MTEEHNKEIFEGSTQQKRTEVSLKSLELDFKINPEGNPQKTKQLLEKIGDTTMLTIFEESPKIWIDLFKIEQESTQTIILKNSEWNLLNPLDSGRCAKDINDKLFGFMRILNKRGEDEIWMAYEQIEYAPYILAPVGEFFLLSKEVVTKILNMGLELEFQNLIQFEGEYLEIKANLECDFESRLIQ